MTARFVPSDSYTFVLGQQMGNYCEVYATKDHVLVGVYGTYPHEWSWEIWDYDPDCGLTLWDQARSYPTNYRKIMKRKDKADIKPADHASRAGLEKLPSFGEFMTSGAFDDGTLRQAPSMSVWCSGGEWKCSIRDREENLVMWLSADTWAALMKLIDSFCLAPDGPWRHEDPQHPRDGKRIKKG